MFGSAAVRDRKSTSPAKLAPNTSSLTDRLVRWRPLNLENIEEWKLLRDGWAYTCEVAGAISFPEADVDTRVNEIPKDKLVIAYCQ